jgi:tetratricopeptide (TPR) repeat protein
MEMVTKIIKKRERDEKRTARNVIIRIFFVILSLLVLIVFLRTALSGYYSRNISERSERKISLATLITGEDARYQYLLGFLHYAAHNKPELKEAVGYYLLSLKRNPTNSQVWLALARAYQDLGMTAKAEHAIRRTIYLDRNNPNLIWEAAVFFLRQNEASDAIQTFRRYIYMIPSDQENVYSLCFALGVTPEMMINALVPESYNFYRRYLSFVMSNKLIGASAEAWKKLKAFNPERKDYLEYCDFLISSGELEEARSVWNEFAKTYDITDKRPSDEMLWNGDFEIPIEDGGFDWKIGSYDGVRIFIDKDIRWTGFASLNVNFNGKTNPGLYIARQIVPVSPGRKYKLSGYVRTQGITTLNGIVIEASGFLCDPFVKKTEPVTGTSLWKKIELEFTTPRKCEAVGIGIKREHSGKLDNKINGDAWIDSFSLVPGKK